MLGRHTTPSFQKNPHSQFLRFYLSINRFAANMDDIEKLEHLSLVQKVVSELYNHTGLHEQVLGIVICQLTHTMKTRS